MAKRIGRRDFIRDGSAAVAGAGLASQSGTALGQNKSAKSRVIRVHKKGVVTSTRKVDNAGVRKMIQTGLKKLTKSSSPLSQFVKPGDRVGLKINTLGRPLLYTHHELVDGMIAELIAVGIKPNDIIVWDRFEDQMISCKFKINRSKNGVRYFGVESKTAGTKEYDGKTAFISDRDNKDRRDKNWGTSSPVAKVLLNDIDKNFNLAILKDHSLAGVTLCLKNIAYGVTCNNARVHGRDYIDNFIADTCAIKAVRDKTVLHLVDGLEGCFDNGPKPSSMSSVFSPETIWFGTDPVALDRVTASVIEAKRKAKDLPTLKALGRPISHIDVAAKKGLGVADSRRIRIEKITL